MYPTGPWLNAINEADNPTLNYGFVPFPVSGDNDPKTVAVTDSLGLSAACENKAEAWEFVEFMYQEPYRQKFDEVEGMLPEPSPFRSLTTTRLRSTSRSSMHSRTPSSSLSIRNSSRSSRS